LVSPIVSPEDIGTFKLLDVDASGVPRDLRGLVRPGNAFGFSTYFDDSVLPRRVKERGPSEDFTKHIEADWDGDSQRLNICVRYKGRRLGTLNPVDADHRFLLSYVPPVEKPREGVVEEAIEWTAEDLLQGKVIVSSKYPVVIQAYGKPCMRYAFCAMYGNPYDVRMASNCLLTALENIPGTVDAKGNQNNIKIVITGHGIRG
jgi:hypothetical protein